MTRLVRERPATALLALVGLVAGVVIMAEGRDTTFYYDEWNFVLERRGWDLDTFLEPHNEHFSLIPILIYKLMFAVFGLDHYGAYRLAILLVHLVIVVLVFVLVSRRIGDWAGLALCLPLLFLGSGWLDILWPFQLGFLISIAGALGAALAIERGERNGDAIACGLLVLAICSSSLGVPVAIAVGASILLGPDRRERAWVFVVPLAIYAVWYLGYGKSAAKASNLDDIPSYVAEAAAGAMSAVSGLGKGLGWVLAALLAILVIRELLKSRRPSPRFALLLLLPLAFWVLTALARAHLHEPAAPRYLYPGAVFVLLLLAYFLERLPLGPIPLALLLVAALGSAALNTQDLADGRDHLKGAASVIKTDLAGVEIAGPHVDPRLLADFVVNPGQPQIKAGAYLEAIRDVGSSPAFTEAELSRLAPDAREAVDAQMIRVYGPLMFAQAGGRPGGRPKVSSLRGGSLTSSRSCIDVKPKGPSVLELIVPPSGLRITPLVQGGIVEFRLRRYGDLFQSQPLTRIPSGFTNTLQIPGDSSPSPWRTELRSEGRFQVCGVATGIG